MGQEKKKSGGCKKKRRPGGTIRRTRNGPKTGGTPKAQLLDAIGVNRRDSHRKQLLESAKTIGKARQRSRR